MAIVYWSPWYPEPLYPQHQLLYDEPPLLLNQIMPYRNKENTRDNWFQCHAFNGAIKNTFVLESPIAVNFAVHEEFKVIDTGTKNKDNLLFCSLKEPSRTDSMTFSIMINWIFWSDEPLEIVSMPPYMSRPLYDGFYVPGSFDISNWFRPLEMACQLHPEANRIIINRNDPLAYIKFNSKETVELKRFYLTPELEKLSYACMNYKRHEPNRSLRYLYDRFTNNGLQTKISKEIKNNLV